MREFTLLDVTSLFHALLFAYQKTQDEILGFGASIMVHPILKTVDKILRDSGIDLRGGGTSGRF